MAPFYAGIDTIVSQAGLIYHNVLGVGTNATSDKPPGDQLQMTQFTTSEIIWHLIAATRWTLVLSLIAFAGGGVFGFIVTMLRISPISSLKGIGAAYIYFFQGTPLLMQLFLAFFGAALLGLDVSAFIAAAIALIAFTAAFLAEIWRGAFQSVPKPQWEAAEALGFNYFEQVWYIILPQAVKISIPPTVGFSVQVIKATSLASIIGFNELVQTAKSIDNVVFQPTLIFGIVAIIYFSLCYPLTVLGRKLEGKFDAAR